jgi:hypothetical protein
MGDSALGTGSGLVHRTMARWRELDPDEVLTALVVEDPVLTGLERLDHRVTGLAYVLARML